MANQPKSVPTVTDITYRCNHGTTYIDVAKDLSRHSRRLYRQMMTYGIAGVTVSTGDFQYNDAVVASIAPHNIDVEISVLPDTWVVRNSVVKGYHMWRKQIKQATEDAGINPLGRWADFKVYMDDEHAMDGSRNSCTRDHTVHTGDFEWNYAEFTMPVHTDPETPFHYSLHVLGQSVGIAPGAPHGATKGLIELYEESRREVEPNAEGIESTGFYASMFDDGGQTSEIIDLQLDENDLAPYDMDDMVTNGAGNMTHDKPWFIRRMSTSAFNRTASCGFFPAPLGLIAIHNDRQYHPTAGLSDLDQPVDVTIHIASGNYKGVLAESLL